MKEYKVRFYKGMCQSSQTGVAATIPLLLNAEFTRQVNGGCPQAHQVGDRYVELSDLQSINHGAVYQGVVRLLRDDAPHKRDASGIEHTFELLPGDKLIEKNHFLFYSHTSLLVWQVNARACHYSSLAGLLTCLGRGQATVSFSDILSPSALQKIQSGALKKLKVKFAAPKNARQYDAHDWTDLSRKVAGDADNATVAIEVSVGASSTMLPERFKSLLLGLVPNTHGEVETLHASVAGQREPIDLLTDCIKDKMAVSLNGGHYPDSLEVFAELEQAKTRQQALLNAILGS